MQICYGDNGVKCDFHTVEWEISIFVFTVYKADLYYDAINQTLRECFPYHKHSTFYNIEL